MQLVYENGGNFGDELNPIVFSHLFPDKLSEVSPTWLIGIGTIIGLKKPTANVSKVIVFSSGISTGLSYGTRPTETQLRKYHFICVRGPLTSQLLGIDKRKAIADGAILLPNAMPELGNKPRGSTVGFIPHHTTTWRYPTIKKLIETTGIKFIDPKAKTIQVLQDIASCDKVLCEAMHGAIIADSLRIPWRPVFSSKLIDYFKWEDYTRSLSIEFKPNRIPTLIDGVHFSEMFRHKIERHAPKWCVPKTSATLTAIEKGRDLYQALSRDREFLRSLQKQATKSFILSNEKTLNERKSQLIEEADKLRETIN